MLLAEVKNPSGLRLTKSDTDGIWLHFEAEGTKAGGIRLDDDPRFPSRIAWAHKQFETAEAKKSTDKAPEVSAERPQLSADDINITFTQLQNKTQDRLLEKGKGILISRHEMLGVITEEYDELIRAVEGGDMGDVEDELVDITVAGIIGIASIKTGQVEW